MRHTVNRSVMSMLSLTLAGCGLGVAQIPEVGERADPLATLYIEKQIKAEIFCELRAGALIARQEGGTTIYTRTSKGVFPLRNVSNLPDSWGVQVSLTLTVDEMTSFNPTATLHWPLSISGGKDQRFDFGFGLTGSSQNVRYDKYDFYYSARDLIQNAGPEDTCHKRPYLGPRTNSTPFVDATKLGIREWLPTAVKVIDFQPSSREALTGEGKALGKDSDSATYDNKFVIISGATAAPIFSLVRVDTGSSLLNLNRTRTHELLLTVGPGSSGAIIGRNGRVLGTPAEPSVSAANSHFASQIGSAVANAIRGR